MLHRLDSIYPTDRDNIHLVLKRPAESVASEVLAAWDAEALAKAGERPPSSLMICVRWPRWLPAKLKHVM